MPEITLVHASHALAWDEYVCSHAHASVYHLYAFRQAVEKTYGRASVYLAAFDESSDRITGVLPLFIISGMLFGRSLVSLPFCDYGGILYNDEKTGALLFEKALSLLSQYKCGFIELRQTSPLPFLSSKDPLHLEIAGSKARMKLALPGTTDALFSSFPAKLRSQVRKPQKEGCTVAGGGEELLDDFYTVFVYNMRDLGSPVHSKKMMANVLQAYGPAARIFVVYKNNAPIACSLVVGFNKNLVNPWASFNKNYRACAPNMLLYWSMLEFAIQNGYTSFDFGRSTKDEGTYRFKEQWGAQPEPLTWYYYHAKEHTARASGDGNKRALFINLWRRLPLGVTKIVGPVLRKQISL
jgi:serine/alanine adding enzyme